jgi:hypothetical protein
MRGRAWHQSEQAGFCGLSAIFVFDHLSLKICCYNALSAFAGRVGI